MNPWPVAWTSLRRSRWGALAIVLVIGIAVAMGIAVSAQERALRQGSARAADPFDILVGAPGNQTQLVLTGIYLQPAALPLMEGEVFQGVLRRNGVRWAAPLAFGDSLRGLPIVGTTAAFVTLGGTRAPAQGRLFEADGEAVVGADVPLEVGARFTPVHGESRADGHALPGQAHHDGHEITVVGRLPRSGSAFDRAILVPIEALWEMHGLPTGRGDGDERIGPPWAAATGGMPVIVVKAASVADAYRLRGQLRTPSTTAFFPAEVLVELYGTLGEVKRIVSTMAVISQILVCLAIVVAVMAALASCRRDAAVLRALGAPRLFIGAALWLGLAAIIAAGVLLGVALGWAMAAFASSVLSKSLGFALALRLGVPELEIAAMALGVGLLVALLPAVSLYRQPVLDALRS